MSLCKTTTNYTCSHCSKKYVRKSDCAKHAAACNILCKNQRETAILSEECENLYTIKQLSVLYQELTFKYVKMEEKLVCMQKWVEKQKKKINIISWLNENNIPTNSFKILKENISSQISQQHIEYLIQTNLITTIQNIFENNEILCGSSPIFCLEQKHNIFYIFKEKEKDKEKDKEKEKEKENENSTVIPVNSWDIMTKDDLICILNYIHSKLLREIIVWKKNHEYAIANEDKMSILYNKTMIKLMEIDLTNDNILCKIKTSLFTYLKKDLKNMIEYEFE